jgi:hypothetical protein
MVPSARHDGQRELLHFFLLMLSRWALMVAYAQLWERAHEIAMVLLCCEAPVLLVLTTTTHYIIIGDSLTLAMERSIRNTLTTLDIIWTAIVGGGVTSALWLDGDKYTIRGAISDVPCPLTTIFRSFFTTKVASFLEADTVLPLRLQPRQF